jgi:hypothetical protein
VISILLSKGCTKVAEPPFEPTGEKSRLRLKRTTSTLPVWPRQPAHPLPTCSRIATRIATCARRTAAHIDAMSSVAGLADEGWVVLVEGSGRGEKATYLVGLPTPPECEGAVRELYRTEPGAMMRAVAPLSPAALKAQKLERGEVRPW